jgi:hypothetical protein
MPDDVTYPTLDLPISEEKSKLHSFVSIIEMFVNYFDSISTRRLSFSSFV